MTHPLGVSVVTERHECASLLRGDTHPLEVSADVQRHEGASLLLRFLLTAEEFLGTAMRM